jgi:hypothetical protein
MDIQRIWNITTKSEKWLALIAIVNLVWWEYCVIVYDFGISLYLSGFIWGASGSLLYLSLTRHKRK